MNGTKLIQKAIMKRVECKHEWKGITDVNSTGVVKCINCGKVLYDKDLYFNVNERYYGNI